MRNDWQEIFEAVRDNVPVNTPIQWDDICEEVFGIPVPEDRSSAEWKAHIHTRNEYKAMVNLYCDKHRENWRLYSFVKRSSVIRREKSDMLNNETQDRLRYVAGSLKRIKIKLRPMASADGISSRDQKLIQNMVDMATGATMTIGGMISNMTSLNSVQKQELLEQFGIVKQPELE